MNSHLRTILCKAAVYVNQIWRLIYNTPVPHFRGGRDHTRAINWYERWGFRVKCGTLSRHARNRRHLLQTPRIRAALLEQTAGSRRGACAERKITNERRPSLIERQQKQTTARPPVKSNITYTLEDSVRKYFESFKISVWRQSSTLQLIFIL